MRWGSWWCVQKNNGFSIGIHIDLRRRRTAKEGIRYGPYVDFHLVQWVVSLGVNPAYAGDLDLVVSFARGGIRASEH